MKPTRRPHSRLPLPGKRHRDPVVIMPDDRIAPAHASRKAEYDPSAAYQRIAEDAAGHDRWLSAYPAEEWTTILDIFDSFDPAALTTKTAPGRWACARRAACLRWLQKNKPIKTAA